MEPQKDYAGKNTHRKNPSRHIETSAGGAKKPPQLNDESVPVKYNDFEVKFHKERDENNQSKKSSQIKLSFTISFILIAVFLSIKNPVLLIPVVVFFAIIYFMFFYNRPSPSPSKRSAEIFSVRNIIAYYLVMLFTVGGSSGRHTVLGDIFLSFLAVLLAVLVGTISVLLIIFLIELFGLKPLASKVNEKIELLIPLVGYAFIFSLIYKDVVF